MHPPFLNIGKFEEKLSNNRSNIGNLGKRSENNLIFQKSVIDFTGELLYTVCGAKWSKMEPKWSGGEAIDR